MDRKEQAERFLKLFTGNTRSFGQYMPSKQPPMWTIKGEPVTVQHALNHFDGKVGLGSVPIMDDDTCWWGGIDLDCHGDNVPDIDLKKVAMEIERNNLPLVPCRSKSGGAHLYLFLEKPASAKKVQGILKFWSRLVGFPEAEIFPKQTSLRSAKGSPPLGNWLNLPYFNVESTDRYLYKYGGPVGLDSFLNTAESHKVDPETLSASDKDDHSEAPPCVQQIIKGFAKQGTRNEALYAVALYMQKKNPKDFEEQTAELANEIFDPKLPEFEVRRTIDSVSSGAYSYKCGQSPCQDFCQRNLCYTRKHGIEPRDSEGRPVGDTFSNLRRYQSDPVVWEVDILGHSVRLDTGALLDMRLLRRAALESAAILLPPMKAPQWEVVLDSMMDSLQVFAVPDDASPAGRVRHKLLEFVRRCDLSMAGKIDDLLYGNPVVVRMAGALVVAFRGVDFIDYLKNTRTDELKQAQVWMAVKSLGVDHDEVTVKGKQVEVWYVDVNEEIQDVEIEVPDYAPEY